MRPAPDWWDTVVNGGSFQYHTWTQLKRFPSGEVLPLDVVGGSIRWDAARIPQIEGRFDVWPSPTLEDALGDLGYPADVEVHTQAVVGDYTGRSHTVELEPLWLQQVTRRRDDRGHTLTFDAVDILGRLSANQMTGPVDVSGMSVRQAVDAVLAASGHHTPVTVTGTAPDTVADGTVFDGDGAAAAAELADTAGLMLATTGATALTLGVPPATTPAGYPLVNVTAYTTAVERAPTRVRVQSVDTVDEATTGPPLPGYGTVTATFTRASGAAGGSAAALLGRVSGLRRRLVDVQMLPNPRLQWGDTVDLTADGAGPAVVWSVDLPLGPGPMRLAMRDPQEVT